MNHSSSPIFLKAVLTPYPYETLLLGHVQGYPRKFYKYFEVMKPFVEKWKEGVVCSTLDDHRVVVSPSVIGSVGDYPGQQGLQSVSKSECLYCADKPNMKYGNHVFCDFRRFLPNDHPFRKQRRFGPHCVVPAPRGRVHSDNIVCGNAAALLNKNKTKTQQLHHVGNMKGPPSWHAGGFTEVDSVRDAMADSMHAGHRTNYMHVSIYMYIYYIYIIKHN